jgi:hypothetical protein
MNYAKHLAKNLGGKWTYDQMCSWRCDDGERRVSRYSAGVDEFDNEVGPPQYWLYGDGAPRRAEPYMGAIRLMEQALISVSDNPKGAST